MSEGSRHDGLSRRLRWALAGAAATLLVVSPFAIGASKPDPQLLGGKRNPTKKAFAVATKIASTSKDYGFEVFNTNATGGGAFFGCRSKKGGSRAHREPCIRASNTRGGRAFEFAFTGSLGGIFQVGSNINQPFPAAKPFVTNALGLATGLNADRVDNMHAQDIIAAAVDRASVKTGAQGPQGAQGPLGPRGPQGVQGIQGPPGTPLAAVGQTATNATYSNARVVDLTPVATASTLPAAKTDGVALIDPIQLDQGTYVVQTTFRAFDLNQTGGANDHAVGVAGLFLDSTAEGLTWTSTIPVIDPNNAAQGSSTVVVTVPTGGGTLALRGVVRTGATLPPAGLALAEGGADVIVTQVNSPAP